MSANRTNVRPSTIALALRDPTSPARRPISRLCTAAPPPLDYASLLAVTVGASIAAGAAQAVLTQPNAAAIGLIEEIRLLASDCIDEFQQQDATETEGALEGRLLANPGWALLAEIGADDFTSPNPGLPAAGIELLLSLHNKKPMAAAFCNGVRVALKSPGLSTIDFESLLAPQDGEKVHH